MSNHVTTALLALAIGLGAGTLGPGCVEAGAFACTMDLQCNANGVIGRCDMPTGTCLYTSAGCPGGLETAEGDCFPGTNPTTGGSAGATDGGSTVSAGDTSGDGPGSTSTAPTDTDAGTSDPGTTGASACDGASVDVTDQGIVGASSTFNNFEPALAVDGDLSSSWFSTGPEPGNAPTDYSWTMGVDRCLERVLLVGNALNENPNFRTNFGFESMVVRVFDSGNDLVFEQTHGLVGTPDPDTNIDLGGVVGNRVVLSLTGHEDPSCGGFSELQVIGQL
jgi:hypothetical protein